MQKQLAIKLAVIGIIALLLLVPLAMINGKISERRNFQFQARDTIAQSWTGPQTLLTPILIQPVRVAASRYSGKDQNGDAIYRPTHVDEQRFLIPDQLELSAQATTEKRYQGIYGIPVYQQLLTLQGRFEAERLKAFYAALDADSAVVSQGEPFIALSVSDMRGIMPNPSLRWQQREIPFEPGSGIANLSAGLHAVVPGLMDASAEPEFQITLGLRGMERFRIIPASRHLSAHLQASWPDPKFGGAFLPQSHNISAEGFAAHWQLSHFSTGIEQHMSECAKGICDRLEGIAFGVDFIEAVDRYLQAERSLKYGILFVGLSFVAFFVLEVVRALPIHPLQYALVGFALAVFFLLLTALGEHLSFALAYLIASSACLALLIYYLRFVLKSWSGAFAFGAGLAALYVLLFVIVQAEDLALVMGSTLIFVVLAGVMIFTRRIDWYALNPSIPLKTAR